MRYVVALGLALTACGRIAFDDVDVIDTAPVAQDTTLALAASTTGTLAATDSDGDALTFRIVDAPAHGSVTVDADTGAFSFAATAGASGTDTFTFVASDGALESNVATVTVSLSAHAWTRTLAGSGNDIARAVAVDPQGNVIVAGWSDASIDGQPYTTGLDVYVTKLDRDGNKLWTIARGGPGDQSVNAAITDGSGNIYLAGTTTAAIDGQPFVANNDIMLQKLAPDGTWLWTRLRGAAGFENGTGIGITPAGNIVVVGPTDGAFDGQPFNGYFDAFFCEWMPDGTHVATRIWGGPSSSDLESVQSGTVDRSGNVIAVGYSQPGDTRALTIKWDTTRTYAWSRERGEGPGPLDGPVAGAVVTDASDHIYLAGFTNKPFDAQPFGGGISDAFVAAYDAQGTWLWSRLVGGTGDDNNYPDLAGLTATPTGLLVHGFTTAGFGGTPFVGGTDMFVTKLSFAGDVLWSELLGGPGAEVVIRNAGASDANGFVYVVGTTDGDLDGNANRGGMDGFVTKWNANR